MPVRDQIIGGVAVTVAIVLAASSSLSTSAGVRCSRERRLGIFGRFGATARFTVIGVTSRSFGFAIAHVLPSMPTVHILDEIRTAIKGWSMPAHCNLGESKRRRVPRLGGKSD